MTDILYALYKFKYQKSILFYLTYILPNMNNCNIYHSKSLILFNFLSRISRYLKDCWYWKKDSGAIIWKSHISSPLHNSIDWTANIAAANVELYYI